MNKKFLTALMAAAFTLAVGFASCDYNPDEDGDGSFSMDGVRNSSNTYDYEFVNQSSQKVTVKIGRTSRTVSTSAVLTSFSSREKVSYSPSDKVRPSVGYGMVYFRNK